MAKVKNIWPANLTVGEVHKRIMTNEQPHEMEWANLETAQAIILRSDIPDNQKVHLMKLALDYFTGRGYFLEEWETALFPYES